MATIINNPGGSGPSGSSEPREDGVGTGVILGIIVAIVLIIIAWYAIPGIRGGSASPATQGTTSQSSQSSESQSSQSQSSSHDNLPGTINVNLNGGNTSGNQSTTSH